MHAVLPTSEYGRARRPAVEPSRTLAYPKGFIACSIPGTPAGAVLAIPRWRGFCWFLAGLFVAEFLRLRVRGEMESALLNSCVECARVTLKGV